VYAPRVRGDAASEQLMDPLEVAIRAARTGGALLLEGRERDLEIVEKDDSRTSIVTWADLRSQEAITEVILDSYPAHAIVGEEGTAGEHGASEVWYVDPIDGTTNYSHGFPCFCVSIAFRDPMGIQVGVVYNPHSGDLFAAERGAGATHNGIPMTVSAVDDLRGSLLSTQVQSDDPAVVERFAERARRFASVARAVRSIGSPALALAFVARGWLDAFCEPYLSPWDTQAGALLVAEAGGSVTTFAGQARSIDRHSDLLATNGLLHDRLLTLLDGEGGGAQVYG
jgi:myo-inositol-1(or 4)-monophosphatase